MSLLDYAKRVAVRRVVYLIIAALLAAVVSMFPAKASAQVGTCGTWEANCSKAQAAQACEVRKSSFSMNGFVTPRCRDVPQGAGTNGNFACEVYRSSQGVWTQCGVDGKGQAYFLYTNTSCPAGQTWNSALNKCQTQCDVGEVPDPENPGQCLNSQKCLNKNVNQQGIGSRTWKKRCYSGCMLEWQDDGSASSKKTTVYNANGTIATNGIVYTGKFEYTGELCPVENPAPGQPPELEDEKETKPSENECVKMGNQTACVKPDGKVCAAASTGKEICWAPHETGTKTDQQYMQTKTPGENPTPQALGLPNGDTAEKVKDDFKMKQESSGQASMTTLSTYATMSGANAGAKNQGQKAGTDGTQGGGNGTGDGSGEQCPEGEECEEKNESSGGETCDSPPQSKGDGLLAMIAHQAWQTRCQFKALDDGAKKKGDSLDGSIVSVGDSGADAWLQGGGQSLSADRVAYGGAVTLQTSYAIGDFTFEIPAQFWTIIQVIGFMVEAAAWLLAAKIVFRDLIA